MNHWSAAVDSVGENEYLLQVEHRLGGDPYSADQFAHMVAAIEDGLDLVNDDVVLDLCCGNGILTKEFASKCKNVVGVDFSQALISIANKEHRIENTEYHMLDVYHLNELSSVHNGSYTKILMFGALQYFRPSDLSMLFQHILGLSSKQCLIFLGSIPDRTRKSALINTPKRRMKHVLYKLARRDMIGTWWHADQIRSACEQYGLDFHIATDSSDAPAAHYRFDAIIVRNER